MATEESEIVRKPLTNSEDSESLKLSNEGSDKSTTTISSESTEISQETKQNKFKNGEKEIGAASESCIPLSQEKELVDFKIVYNKQKFDVSFPLDETIAALKVHIQTLTGVPPAMQKVMVKGLAKDEKLLREVGISRGMKVMVIGSTLDDVLAVNSPSTEAVKDDVPAAPSKEPLCKQKMHKKIIDKGVPEDAMPGIKNTKDSLPPFPLCGMLNKSGGKVRLTFKLELDQLWIGTKERTDKIPMNSIKNIVSEPIEGFEQYHIMGIQLGPTEASRYWVYWVPAQYVDAIKDAVLGKWQYF